MLCLHVKVSVPAELRKWFDEIGLPKGVKISHVLQVVILVEKLYEDGWSPDGAWEVIQEHPHGKEVCEWLLTVLDNLQSLPLEAQRCNS